MSVPFLDLQAQYKSIKPDIAQAIDRVLDSSAYVLGPSVVTFEREFAAFCGVKECIGVNSGTAALALLLQAHGIGRGDEVITVANTFFATAEAISEVGATPVLIDCEETTGLMDPTKIDTAITAKTKAIIPVHLYGQTADIAAISAIAMKRHILLFEDACQAHGALEHGKRAGSLADGAAFSFYPGKNLGAYGEAGAVTTDDPQIASTIRILRDHGSPEKYHHQVIGWNERMDGIQGGVLSVKLQYIDAWNERRRAHAKRYRELLPASVQTMHERTGATPVYHLFVIRSPKRDALQEHLKKKGIQTGIHYPIPIHLQPAYADRGWKEGDFLVAEKLSKEILSLPMFPEMTEEQIREVCEAVASM